MLRLVADENFNNLIVRGLLRKAPNADVVRIQDVGLSGADDETILQWAAQNHRIVITHDVSTMTRHAYRRVESGQPMPGVFEVPDQVSIAQAIEDFLLLIQCSVEGEWEGQIRYLPL